MEKAKRVNKWLNEIIVQEMTWKDARATKKDYRDNGVSARIIERRTLNPDYVGAV